MVSVRKRKHAEVAGRAVQAGGGHDAQKFKRQRTYNRKGNSSKTSQNTPKVDSTSALKNRIRNLKRLLSHVDNDADSKMPANIRIERERELETCEHELAEKLMQQRETDFRNKIIGKYHHVRFFERQKATRNVKRLQKQLAALDEELEKNKLRAALRNAEVDLNYTIYYPLLKSYVSLFPKGAKKDRNASTEEDAAATTGKEAASEPDGPKGNVDMWRAVEKAMEEGTLEALRNSREGVTIPGANDRIFDGSKGRKTEKHHRHEEKQKQGKASAPTGDDDEEDSDGGFFE